MSAAGLPRSATYLGADRSGAEFWLSGPHVISIQPDGSRGRPRHVCALARFNRRRSCRGRGRTPTRKVPT